MLDPSLKRLHRVLSVLYAIGFFQKKRIYIFGVSYNSRQAITSLRLHGFEPVAIIDNDKRKVGSYFMGLRVLAAKDIVPENNQIFIICSFYWVEMKTQLMDLGVKRKSILVISDTETGRLFYNLFLAYRGRRIYKGLIKNYGDIPLFVCPYTGTGDIYLIGSFWKEYVEKNRLEKYVFVVISSACKKVASLFEIDNVVQLRRKEDCRLLLKYYSFVDYRLNLKVLNDSWAEVNANLAEWLRGYKGWNFTELFRKFVFDLPNDSYPRHPLIRERDDELNAMFKNSNLRKKKTVVLSPYSNTLADLPLYFWEVLCETLLRKGYDVCTNSSGKSEPVIKGSVGMFFPLDIAPQFITAAGGFVGVRSGFCDVISGSDAKKVVIYDSNNLFYNTTAYEYFSLKSMRLCDDAIEVEYNRENIDDLIETISGVF